MALYRGRTEAEFVDVSDPANVPPDLSADDAMRRFHVRERGVLRSGAAAFAALWRRTPGVRALGRIAALPGVVHVLEAAYRAFLLVRPALQRLTRRATGEGAADGARCR